MVDAGELKDTFEGTQQGGVISPLLANIALHGLEEHVVGTLAQKINERKALRDLRVINVPIR